MIVSAIFGGNHPNHSSSTKLIFSLLLVDFVVPIVDISDSLLLESSVLSWPDVDGSDSHGMICGGVGNLFGVVTTRLTEIKTGYTSSESK